MLTRVCDVRNALLRKFLSLGEAMDLPEHWDSYKKALEEQLKDRIRQDIKQNQNNFCSIQ